MYPHERSLVKKLADKPFAIIGVNSDEDLPKLHKRMDEEDITWRSFWNGKGGTMGKHSAQWNVSGWPTLYLIDHKGVIRHRDLRVSGEELDRMIDELIAEAEADQKDD